MKGPVLTRCVKLFALASLARPLTIDLGLQLIDPTVRVG